MSPDDGYSLPSKGPKVHASAAGIADVPAQRAVRALERALTGVNEALDARVTALENNISTGTGVVTSVSAGSPMVTAAPTTGDVIVNVVPANFSGIPQSGIVGLVSDLASKVPVTRTVNTTAPLTGGGPLSSDLTLGISLVAFISGTTHRVAKFTGTSSLGDSAIYNNGTNVGVGTTAPDATLTVKKGASGTSTWITPVLEVESDGDAAINIRGPSGNDKALYFTNPTNLADGGIVYDNPSLPRGLQLRTGGNNTRLSIDSSGNATFAGTVTITPMTAGSVIFAGIAGLLSQDNTALFWNNTDKTLVVTSPTATAIGAKSNSTTAGTMFITNTNVSGPSDFYATDNVGTAKVAFGYGNASYSDSARAGRGYIWRNTGVNLVFARSSTVDGMIFSNGNFNIGATTTDPGVKLRVEGEAWATSAATVGSGVAAAATLDVYRGSLGAGTAQFRGTTNHSHFNFSTPEDTYIRGGKSTSAVNVGDTGTGGINIGATANHTAVLGNLAVNGNVTAGNATTDSHTINGVITVNPPNGVSDFAVSVGATAGHNYATVGDTAASFNVWHASSPTNLAFQNSGGGGFSVTISGALSATGNVAIGDAAGDAHTLTGTLNANTTAGSNGQVLAIQSGLPKWVALSGISGVTGLGTNLFIPLWTPDGTNLGVSGMSHTGGGTPQLDANYAGGMFLHGVGSATPVGLNVSVAPSGSTITIQESFRSELAGTYDTTAAVATAYGAKISSTSTRSAGANALTNIALNLSASGGQDNIALLTQSGSVTFQGATTVQNTLSVTGAATLGDASGDAHTVNGNITFQNAPTAGHLKVGSLNARIKIAQQILTASSGTYTPSTGTKAVRVRMVGGGGGGGGAGGGSGARTAGGGGSSGVYWEKWIDPAATVTGGAYACGAGGTAGTSGGGNGGNGGDTTLVVQGTTYTAKGGTGGLGLAADGWVVAVGPQAGSSAADAIAGSPGGNGACTGSGAIIISGNGGSNPFGIGGAATIDAVGVAGTGNGAGSSGANHAGTTDRAGGAGTIGIIIVEEYA